MSTSEHIKSNHDLGDMKKNSTENSKSFSYLKSSYDLVIFGTGLSETILSAILSENHRVLVVDKNNSYGSEFATLNFTELEQYFQVTPNINSNIFRQLNHKFNIDLTPKLLLMESQFKDLLLQYKIDDLVNFSSIKGSFFFSDSLHSIPRSEASCLTSSAVGFFQKPKVISFFYNLRNIANTDSQINKDEQSREISHIREFPNIRPAYNFKHSTMREEFDSFGLNKNAIDFIGHAIAMNLDDSYLDKHPKYTYDRIIRYIKSIVSYDNSESPYIYPQYGLSDICQSFIRRASINGAVIMLNADISQVDVDCDTTNNDVNSKEENSAMGNIVTNLLGNIMNPITNNNPSNSNESKLKNCGTIFLTDPDGVKHEITTKMIVSDPSYFTGNITTSIPICKVKQEIIRCIMICKKNNKNSGSRNITFLKDNLNRKNDIFCVILDSETMACPKEYEIGILSTIKETNYPDDEISKVLQKFDCIKYYIGIRQVYENDKSTNHSRILFTENVDASPLMDNIYDDVQRILKRIDEIF